MTDASSLSLVGGNLALDFANTAAGRDTPTPTAHIGNAADLFAWAAHAGGMDAGTAERCRGDLTAGADVTERLLRHALQFREAIYRVGVSLAGGRRPTEADLLQLKTVAQRALGAATLVWVDGRYRFDFSAAPPEAALLGPIAWSATDMLLAGGFERLKQCASPGCGWLYLDHSKNNSRRWCDMATCGNLAKGRRHRQRRG